MTTSRLAAPAALAALAALLTACASTSIAMKERLGYAKREQLVDEVAKARAEQTDAREQFTAAWEELRALSGAPASELEPTYRRLRAELNDSEDAAQDVRDRVRRVDAVATALFAEWEAELEQYTSDDLRAASARDLEDTRLRSRELIAAMRRAEASMDPVLDAFRDQVLFLKHNLNARAVASLDTTLTGIEGEVAELIARMNASISEAESFIALMSPAP